MDDLLSKGHTQEIKSPYFVLAILTSKNDGVSACVWIVVLSTILQLSTYF